MIGVLKKISRIFLKNIYEFCITMKKITARIFFFKKEDGGRSQSIPPIDIGFPFYFIDLIELSDHAYDCRVLFSTLNKNIDPGSEINKIELRFLSQEKVLKHIKIGSKFKIWEGKIIGNGKISSIE